MSAANGKLAARFVVQDFLRFKAEKKPISMVTCYDAAFAKLIRRSPIDVVLVGDSLGNVVLGYDSTIPVTMKDMVHHTAAVTRILKEQFVVSDMPFFSVQLSLRQALKNAAMLVQDGGANAVKIEGGIEVCEKVRAIVDAGIPVMGHLGLTPQSVNMLGGFKVQGKSDLARQRIMAAAVELERAGACAIVLELVPAQLAEDVSKSLKIPTIGIGAGSKCNGQVLVLHDLLGFDAEFCPRFLKKYANLADIVTNALTDYNQEVKSGTFPSPEHSFLD